jgi:hypothetical protein
MSTHEEHRADEQRDRAVQRLLDDGYTLCATGADCGDLIPPGRGHTDTDGKRYCDPCWRDILETAANMTAPDDGGHWEDDDADDESDLDMLDPKAGG